MIEQLKKLVSELDVDYSQSTIVDITASRWKDLEINAENLQDYISKRFSFSAEVILKRYRMINGYVIADFFFKKDLENYLKQRNS